MTIIDWKNIKEMIWVVVSDKMNKSLVVVVEKVKQHPIYKKRFTINKKYYVHDEDQIAKIWDTVKIRESKPISKLKRWTLVEVINNKVI